MNISELRSTLSEHADFHDDGLAVRVGSVHEQIRVVRRRRRAALAGSVAAVVAVGVAGVTAPWPGEDGSSPANRELLGMTAPGTFVSTDFVYLYDHGVAGNGRARVELKESDEPRVVSWAVRGSDDRARISGPGTTFTSEAGDFEDFVRVEPGRSGTFEVAADGRGVALAVYELDRLPQHGVHGDGFTFRANPGRDRRIAHGVGADGQADLEVSFTMPRAQLAFSDVCVGPERYDVHVEIAGGGDFSTRCRPEAPYDAATVSMTTLPDGVVDASGRRLQAGEPATARVWVTEHGSEEPLTGPVTGLQLGLALYEKDQTSAELGGPDVPVEFEFEGHSYEFDGDASSEPGAPSVSLDLGARDDPDPDIEEHEGPVLVLAAASGVQGDVVLEVDGEVVGTVGTKGSLAFGDLAYVVHTGVGQVVLRLATPTAQSQLVLVQYRRLLHLR